jgi:hypothetical protein
MLNLAFDPTMHVLAAYVGGPQNAPDNERLVAAIDKLDQAGREKSHAVALVLILSPDTQAPNAHWRRRFAEQRRGMKSPRVFISAVTQSAVLRGVLTAMNWISPDPPHVKSLNHGTFEESAAWIESTQGTGRAVLRRLYEEIQPRAKTG